MSEPLKPCPFCGLQPNPDDPSTVHPVGHLHDLFTFNCLEEAGGCTASVLGGSPQLAAAAWNRRDESQLEAARAEGRRAGLLAHAQSLADAADAIEEWGAYANEYFQKKHGLAEEIQSYRATSKSIRALADKAEGET